MAILKPLQHQGHQAPWAVDPELKYYDSSIEKHQVASSDMAEGTEHSCCHFPVGSANRDSEEIFLIETTVPSTKIIPIPCLCGEVFLLPA